MRPNQLTMSAFGPYAHQTSIDFDALGNSGVYLVCGDTGAGKTMIFDAICFALFGEASGDSRGGARSTASLRSDYAEATEKTFVELTFTYRGKRYRVKRNPDYTRAKARGEGETKQAAGAELEFPDGRVVTGVRKVNAEVEALLGIDSEQFKQIVMLAQGEFRKLLTADTDTREGIFRKLFGTAVYEQLQERLAEESRKLERENTRVKTEIATLSGQAAIPADSPAAAGLEERRGTSLLGPWLVETLQSLLAVDRPEHERLDAQVEELRVKWSDANTLLKQVESRPAVEAEKQRLDAEIAKLEQAQPQLAAAFEECVRHDDERDRALARAARIAGTFAKYEALGQAVQAHTDATEGSERSRQRLSDASKAAQDADAAVERLTQVVFGFEGADVRVVQARAALEVAQREAKAAEAAVESACALEAKEAEAQQAARRLDELRAACERAAQDESASADALSQADSRSAALQDAPEALALARAAFDQAKRALKEAEESVKRRDGLAEAITGVELPYREKQQLLLEKERIHERDSLRLQELQRRQRAGRAGLLAAELEEGLPCPVCGSPHHPSPASTGDAAAAIPTDDEIDAASQREEQARQDAAAAAIRAGELKAVYEEKRQQLARFDEETGGPEALQESLRAARRCFEEARDAAVAAEERKGAFDKAMRELESARKKHETLAVRLADASAAVQTAREGQIVIEAALQTMREAPGATSAQDARDALAIADARRTAAQDALTAGERDARKLAQAQQELAAAREATAQAQAAVEQARAAAQDAGQAEAIAGERVAQLRADLEFPDLSAAQAQVAELRGFAGKLQEARDAAQKELRDNEAQRNTDSELLKAVERQLAVIPVADVDETRAAMAEFTRQGNELKAVAAALKTRIDANASCLVRLERALDKAGGIEERYGRVKALAEVATGNVVGRSKVRFEAYVQAIYFDKVIEAANVRLKALTSGQFELVRYSEGAGNAKAGLGLYVIDSFTGRARDASSLSGGESFQASLCLALGLSDIVQAHAGGIEFDTMFVDEGFGSLDAGALGNAISLLSDLSGGTKLVGIISHVEDLKANIPKKLVVTKSRTGSSVKLEL